MPSRAIFLTIMIIMMCAVNALLKSASGANKFVCILDKVLMELEAKQACIRVERVLTQLLKATLPHIILSGIRAGCDTFSLDIDFKLINFQFHQCTHALQGTNASPSLDGCQSSM